MPALRVQIPQVDKLKVNVTKLTFWRLANYRFSRVIPTVIVNFVGEIIGKCPQLQGVDFEKCCNLMDAATEPLAQCPQLRSAGFAGCRQLTDVTAGHL